MGEIEPLEEARSYLGIDMGARYCGYAMLNGKGFLYKAGYVPFDPTDLSWVDKIPAADFVAVERMRIYPQDTKGDLNSLLDIERNVGFFIGAISNRYNNGASLFLPTPAEWNKGQPKKVSSARTLHFLSHSESNVLQAYSAKTKSHIIDATGIAKWLYKQVNEVDINKPSYGSITIRRFIVA